MGSNGAVSLLNCFSIEKPELGLSDICKRSGCPKSTAIRYLKILENEGFVIQNTKTKKYALGYKVYRLFSIVANTKNLHKVALRYMQDLRALNNETVSLYELVGDRHCVRIERLLSRDRVQHNNMIGLVRPLHVGSPRKAILAFMPEEKIQKILSQNMERFTERTVTDPDVLLKELREIRKNGYAVSNGELKLGARSISVPIWINGSVRASLAVGGPEIRISNKDVDHSIVKQLQLASQNITRELESGAQLERDRGKAHYHFTAYS